MIWFLFAFSMVIEKQFLIIHSFNLNLDFEQIKLRFFVVFKNNNDRNRIKFRFGSKKEIRWKMSNHKITISRPYS